MTSASPASITRWAGAARPMRCSHSASRGAAAPNLSASSITGSSYMFQMMNAARIGVGMNAVALGYAAYMRGTCLRARAPAGPAADAQGPDVAAGRHPASRRRAPDAAGAEILGRGRTRARALLCRLRTTSAARPTTARQARLHWPARAADADREVVAVGVLPRGQQAGDPGARRLRLHARLPGRAPVSRQPAEPHPRGHARHPRARPARSQDSACTAARRSRTWFARMRTRRSRPHGSSRNWPGTRQPLQSRFDDVASTTRKCWSKRCREIRSARSRIPRSISTAWAPGRRLALAGAGPGRAARDSRTIDAEIAISAAASCSACRFFFRYELPAHRPEARACCVRSTTPRFRFLTVDSGKGEGDAPLSLRSSDPPLFLRARAAGTPCRGRAQRPRA